MTVSNYKSLIRLLNEPGNGNSDIYSISSNVLFQLRDLHKYLQREIHSEINTSFIIQSLNFRAKFLRDKFLTLLIND